jgi:hypothetical protein
MTKQAHYEYRMVYIDDDRKRVNDTMQKRAEDGWELVSGSAVSYEERATVRLRYVMYWRRPRADEYDV